MPGPNLAVLALATVGCLALGWCLFMFAFWLSSPSDMWMGNNSLTMAAYTAVSLLSVTAIYFGFKCRKR